MSQPAPFLQIVHISDLHAVAPDALIPDPIAVRMALRGLARVGPKARIAALDQLIRDGTAAHLPQALRAFSAFLPEITVRDEEFKDLPTWLVQTGDLTTYGDTASLQFGHAFLELLQRHTGVTVVSIHGNHDAWPGTFPLSAAEHIVQHEAELRTFFPDVWPRAPLTARFPDDSGEIQLYGIDTVNPQAWPNAWARGVIPPTKLDALRRLVHTHAKERERQFRILVSHHPLRYPEPRPRYAMVLEQQHTVCAFLRKRHGQGVTPLVHLILSGHTHHLSPPLYELPETVAALDQIPLGAGQCQLVVGSLSQLDTEGQRGELAHQCQILRFYYESSDPGIIWVYRLVAARRSGQSAGRGVGFGAYEILDDEQDGATSAQAMTMPC